MSRWTLYVDESGVFPTWGDLHDPEFVGSVRGRRSVAGVLVRDGRATVAARDVRRRLTDAAPWAPWPFHATEWNESLSHVLWAAVATAEDRSHIPGDIRTTWDEAFDWIKGHVDPNVLSAFLEPHEGWAHRGGKQKVCGRDVRSWLVEWSRAISNDPSKRGLGGDLRKAADSLVTIVSDVFYGLANDASRTPAVPLLVSEGIAEESFPISPTDPDGYLMHLQVLVGLAGDHVAARDEDAELHVYPLRRTVECRACVASRRVDAERHAMHHECVEELIMGYRRFVNRPLCNGFANDVRVIARDPAAWGPATSALHVWADWLANAGSRAMAGHVPVEVVSSDVASSVGLVCEPRNLRACGACGDAVEEARGLARGWSSSTTSHACAPTTRPWACESTDAWIAGV